MKVPKDFEKSKVEALFSELVDINGYKYMQCGNPKLIACIKNLWMVLHQKTGLPITVNSHCHDQRFSLRKEGESCHELGLVYNMDEKKTGS